MSNELTLILSELAGNLEISVSAADSQEQIAAKIIDKFQGFKTLELSEREQTAVRTTREIQIDELGRLGVPPVICNAIKQETCGSTLALSEDAEKFNFWIERLKDVQNAKIISLSEKTKAQVEKERFESDPNAQWEQRTKNMQPI